ncbi:MAG: thioredoxin family protein [Candidatus Dormibacteraeota bacterium]|nr:thioredoxin family protein [Candidatus Dormibacteraeota bacterium]MBV9526068.1 thioredoxin family protein [Candidatus Dormibacteraeota bacterium]
MILVALAPVIAVAIVGAAALALQAQRAGQRRLVGRRVDLPADLAGAAAPTLLYFTGEACTICHTAQTPALQRLAADAPPYALREVDVAVEPALARRYRVMSLPTTVVVDARGRVAAVNTGYASTERLREQLDEARRAVAA